MDWENLFHINLQEHGSGNTGTTNTFRILGKKAGVIVFTIDFLKGTFGRSPSDFLWNSGDLADGLWSLSRFGAHFPNFLLDLRVERQWRRVLVSYLVSRLSCYSF